MIFAQTFIDPAADFLWEQRASRLLAYMLALDAENGPVLGAVMGVDHEAAFGDPEGGTSLWSLALGSAGLRTLA